jgi:hypothetical protein
MCPAQAAAVRIGLAVIAIWCQPGMSFCPGLSVRASSARAGPTTRPRNHTAVRSGGQSPTPSGGSGSDRVKHVCVAGWLTGEESLPPGPTIGDGLRPRIAHPACHAAGSGGRQDVEFEFVPGLPLELTEHRGAVAAAGRAVGTAAGQPAGVAATAASLLPVMAQQIAAGVHLLGRDILVEVR